MTIPFASRSHKFTAAVPVTPASTAARATAAAAPPLVEVKIADPDAATSSTAATATARTPTRKVRHRQPPSAPPTTPMAPSRELECDSSSSSTSSTPESTLVATNTTPTTIATLSAVSTKLLPSTTTESSRDEANDELVARTSTSTSTSSTIDTTTTTTCATTSEKVTPAIDTIPSTSTFATDVDKKQQVQNSVDAPPSATKQEDDTDINHNNNNDDDDNKSSDHKKANDATDPTIVGGSSSPPTDLKMKDEDATVATAKTGGGSDDGDVLHSDRLFAFDPNSIDDVLNLSGNESEMMMVGPSPAKSSFGHHEQYAFHHHHQPYDEQAYYYPNPHHNPHCHQMGIVSPATAASMAPRYMAPASFATGTPSADATRYSYDPNPSGTSFRDESAYLDRTEGATGENVAKFLPAWSPIKTPKPTKPQKKKLLTDTGTTVTVKIDGMEINDEQPSRPNPPPIHHDYHRNNGCGNYGAMEQPQVQYHHPSNHHTVVSVLHHSPPDSPTPSVSSTSILEAVLKVREEFSNDGGCDRLGTAPSICTINHDAGLHVYAPNPVAPVPHTIAFGDSRSGAVTDISVSSWSASRRTTPSTSTFDMSGRVPTPNGEHM